MVIPPEGEEVWWRGDAHLAHVVRFGLHRRARGPDALLGVPVLGMDRKDFSGD